MPRAAVAVEETMVEAQLVVTKPLKFKVSVPFMHFFLQHPMAPTWRPKFEFQYGECTEVVAQDIFQAVKRFSDKDHAVPGTACGRVP